MIEKKKKEISYFLLFSNDCWRKFFLHVHVNVLLVQISFSPLALAPSQIMRLIGVSVRLIGHQIKKSNDYKGVTTAKRENDSGHVAAITTRDGGNLYAATCRNDGG